MQYHVKVDVRLRKDILDPAGRAVENSLHSLGYSAENVRIGKIITLIIKADSPLKAEEQASEMAKALLANPVMEDFHIDVQAIDQ